MPERIRIVLVEPQHPGNIGAAARAMKNMGLSDLALVSPHRFPHPEAEAMAAGASDILEQARVCSSLAEAVADCQQVAATSARPRHISVPVMSPREWAPTAVAAPGRTALLFGRERTGLTNEELDAAHQIVVIPTGSDYRSLNLAAAVQILSYELQCAAGGEVDAPLHEPVAQLDMERFYEHLERLLVTTQFLDPNNPRHLMRKLRKIYSRTAPDANEMNILRGILTACEQSIDRAARGLSHPPRF